MNNKKPFTITYDIGYGPETHTVSKWANILGISRYALYWRLKAWTYEEVFILRRKRNSTNYNIRVQCIETGKIYNSMTEAANEYGTESGSIGLACRGKLATTGGVHWQYVKD